MRSKGREIGELEINRDYYFVRRRRKKVELARFTRFADGSALLDEGEDTEVFEMSSDAWQAALLELQELGYTEISEAIRRGIISKEQADHLITRAPD